VLNGEKLGAERRESGSAGRDGANAVKNGGRQRAQANHSVHRCVDTPGLEIAYRCRFMGLRGLYNAVVKFTDVRIPRENIIFKEGAAIESRAYDIEYRATHIARSLRWPFQAAARISRKWAGERIQWGVLLQTRRDCWKNCRDGRQRFRDGMR